MSKLSPAIAALAILVSVSIAHAQLFGGGRRNVAPADVPQADALDPAMCDQLASIPNAPMSAEACRSMMMMQQSMKAASTDPRAVRPGDEAMSCEQIIAELKATSGPMISQETAAQSKAAGEASVALMEKQNAEAKAFIAGQVAMGVGTGALSMLPGGGYAAQAAQMAMMAQQKAFADKQAAEAAPVRAQTSQALTRTGSELGQAMQSNPRMARLMQLTMDKNCQLPADAAPRATP
jgi:hypothetical protein